MEIQTDLDKIFHQCH